MKKEKYYHLDGTPFSEAQMEIMKGLEESKGTKIEIREVHSPEKVQGQLMNKKTKPFEIRFPEEILDDLYLAATAYEYEDAYNNFKYGLRVPHYCVNVDLNQYEIM
jgi:hypothetical protein